MIIGHISGCFDLWVDPDVQCHHYHVFDLLNLFNIIEELRGTG